MTTARHWITPGFTGIETLELVEHDVPAPAAGEVTVEVRAAAIDVSVALLTESGTGTEHFVTIGNSKRARAEGLTFIAGSVPESAAYRDQVRAEVIAKAAEGTLTVPLGPSFPLTEAKEALALLKDGHPGGKVTLIP